MTKEQYLAFKPFEPQLHSVKASNYARFPAKSLQEFSEAVLLWRGEGLKKNERTCNHCLLTLCKKIADEFFKYQDSPRGKALLKKLENNVEEEGNGKEE